MTKKSGKKSAGSPEKAAAGSEAKTPKRGSAPKASSSKSEAKKSPKAEPERTPAKGGKSAKGEVAAPAKPSSKRSDEKAAAGGKKSASFTAKSSAKAASAPASKPAGKSKGKPEDKQPSAAKEAKGASSKGTPSKPAASKTGKGGAKAGSGESAPKGKAAVESEAKKDAKAGTKAPAAPEKPGKGAAKEPVAAAKAGDSGDGDDAKNARKGITIVNKKVAKKPAVRTAPSGFVPPGVPLLGAGVRRKPLIASGPKAAMLVDELDMAEDGAKRKSPFGKKDLARYREVLLARRAVLYGDVSNMEREALQSSSGSLSNNPQHMADQGTDASDQNISLDIAAADRKLIKEIDDALARIDAGTYGICELTGKPINIERLEELPWTRYSIEAARMLERQHSRV